MQGNPSPIESGLWNNRMMHYPHLVWIMAMVIWALGGCETDRDAVSVLESSRMEFDDLFIFEDSI